MVRGEPSSRVAGIAAFMVPLVFITRASPASRKSGRSRKLAWITRASLR
jgi:hypothetical protein